MLGVGCLGGEELWEEETELEEEPGKKGESVTLGVDCLGGEELWELWEVEPELEEEPGR